MRDKMQIFQNKGQILNRLRRLVFIFLISILFVSCSKSYDEPSVFKVAFSVSSSNVLVDETINFINNTTGVDDNATYLWDFGDGSTSDVKSPEHSYAEPADYYVVLKVTESSGQQKSYSITINVSQIGDIVGRLSLRDTLQQSPDGLFVCAHRGCHENYPENSLAAIQAAIDKGIFMVEVDVRSTKDGILVLMHDASIDRTTNGAGTVSEMTFDEIEQHKLLQNNQPTSYKVPSLEDAFKLARGKIYLNLDIDAKANYRDVYELAKKQGMLKQVLFYTQDEGDIDRLVIADEQLVVLPYVDSQSDFDKYSTKPNMAVFHYTSGSFNDELVSSAREKNIRIYKNVYVNSDIDPTQDNYKWVNDFILGKGNIMQTDYPELLQDYINDYDITNIEPSIEWSYILPGSLEYVTSPAIADDGTVFIASVQEVREDAGPNIVAVKNGSLVWEQVLTESTPPKSDRIAASFSIAPDGSLYIGTWYSRKVFHIDQINGEILAEYNTNGRIRYSCPVLAADGSVYIGSYNNDGKGFYSLKPSLADKNWVFQPGMDFNSTPAIGTDGTIYVAAKDGDIFAVNPDGTEKWSAQYGSWAATAIAIGPNGTVYMAGERGDNDEGVLIAYNPSDGSELWRNELNEKINHGGPAIAPNGTVYAGGKGGKLVAYDPETGSEEWEYQAVGDIDVVPAIDNDGNIYFGDSEGYFHVVDNTGAAKWKVTKLGDEIVSSVAIGDDGTIYVAANEEGATATLYALKTNARGLAQGGWPMYAKNPKHTGR